MSETYGKVSLKLCADVCLALRLSNELENILIFFDKIQDKKKYFTIFVKTEK